MNRVPKSLRLQIGLFGRTNVGKSSFLNMVAGQDVAVTSAVPGTTTDVVEKSMELLPLGPVVFLDTAGLDDGSGLGGLRLEKTRQIFRRADIFVLITEPDRWGDYEEAVVAEARRRHCPCLVVVNKIDHCRPGEDFRETLETSADAFCLVSSLPGPFQAEYVNEFKNRLMALVPEAFFHPPPLVGDLLPPGGLAVLVVPIDLQAPKGRLILPQVQTIRDALDNDAAVMVVKERELAHRMALLNEPPDLVVCDSQVVLKMVADTPSQVPCTTFSILFARLKGDLRRAARGAAVIDRLCSGDRVLIAEACSHHPAEDDIGRVKIPRWLRQYTGLDLKIHICAGRDYPKDLYTYRLIIHCGACMLTRREMLTRLHEAEEAGVAITNYGLCIAALQGVAPRVLAPFPAALDAFHTESIQGEDCHVKCRPTSRCTGECIPQNRQLDPTSHPEKRNRLLSSIG